jgi:UDP:flavonoid glycosyltransferase YjiC (YdhE family)
MRVLFSTWPAHGHVLPLLPLVRAAERAGHDVVLASGAEGAAEARRRGLTTWTVGPSRAESDAAFRRTVPRLDAFPEHERIPTVVAGMFGAAAFKQAADLVPLAERWAPDVVVHPVTELAGAVAAHRTGARHVVHGLGPLPSEAWAWFGARFGAARWDVPDLAERILDRPYLDTCPPVLQTDAVSAFHRRVPLRPGDGDLAPGDTLPWSSAALAALPHDRTVHLTLGTLFNGATHVFDTVLRGLATLPVNVLVTVGPGTDPRRLGPQPPHVLVADWAPHALLLPWCDALITQGGAGTIVAALCHGLPHLILPQGADQFRNAATAGTAGVAAVLPPPRLTAHTVAEETLRLLDDERLRETCRDARTSVEAMPDADEVWAGLMTA